MSAVTATLRPKDELTEAIRRDSRAVLVVNTRSRRGHRAYPRLARLLAERGVHLLADLPVTDPLRFTATLEQALAMEPDLLVLGGGDGTMATAVDLLAHRDVALGVLPLGTTNNFARSLGLPLSVAGAVRTIASGKVADVDLGCVRGPHGEDLFCNLASLGLSVEVAHQVPHLLKRVLGRAAYPITAARILPSHHPFRATVSWTDETGASQAETFWTHQLNIANGRSHAGRPIARDASIDDGLLVAYRLGGRERSKLSRATVEQVVLGPHRDLAMTPFLVVPEVRVETDPPLGVDVDGEVLGTTPVTISCAPQALRVVLPESYVDR